MRHLGFAIKADAGELPRRPVEAYPDACGRIPFSMATICAAPTQSAEILQQFDQAGSPIDRAPAWSDARRQAISECHNDDCRQECL